MQVRALRLPRAPRRPREPLAGRCFRRLPALPLLLLVLLVLVAIAALPDTADATAHTATATATTAAGAAGGAPQPASGVWPLQPRPPVVTGFDPPASRYGRGHRGVDLLGHVGQPVHAALGGRITFAGSLAGRGVVVVDHGSTRTTYQPVAATVDVGDQVARGAVVGRLLLVGSHCFPRACLHWGLIEGRDHYLDPLVLVGAVPVRLLPLGGVPTGVGPPFAAAAGLVPLPGPPGPRLPAPRLPVTALGPVGVPGRLGFPGPEPSGEP
jgi:murein DD-endopeptidase MepM/ murein hydrolase activator NlpD